MSSCIDSDLKFYPDATSTNTDPLPEGKYYLVDISEAVEDYMRIPSEVRMTALAESADFTEHDVLDIELSSLIPCLSDLDRSTDAIQKHINEELDHEKDMLSDTLIQLGADMKSREVFNTANQLAHADALHQLGIRIFSTLKENSMYSEHGELMGEHCTLLRGGVLVLREA